LDRRKGAEKFERSIKGEVWEKKCYRGMCGVVRRDIEKALAKGNVNDVDWRKGVRHF